MVVVIPHEALVRRDIPKIKGSSGAFIAVVVVLVLIIVVACSAVTYLIYESRQLDERQPHRQYQTSTSRGFNVGGTPTSNSPSRSLLRRLGLSRHKKKVSTTVEDQKPRRGGQGWVQAAGDDGDDDESSVKKRASHAAQMSEVLDTSRPPSVSPSANASPASTQRPLPLDTRPRVSSMLSDTSMSIASYREGTNMRYNEPFAPIPQRSISTVTTHLAPSMFSSPSSTPPPGVIRAANASPEPLSGDESLQVEGAAYPNGKGRPFATRSGTSMLTFEGGTKFVEEI